MLRKFLLSRVAEPLETKLFCKATTRYFESFLGEILKNLGYDKKVFFEAL